MTDTRPRLNPFDNTHVASGYERWYSTTGREADEEEKHVLGDLLRDFPDARTVLEVGCGTGHFTRWLASLDLEVVGLDLSEAMLTEVVRRQSPVCVRGDAHALPFQAGAFDVVVLITTLEFVQSPPAVLAEAARVAKKGLLIGALNRWSLLALRRRLSRRPVWKSARLFSPPELKRLIRQTAGTGSEGGRWWAGLLPGPGLRRLFPFFPDFLGVVVRLANAPE